MAINGLKAIDRRRSGARIMAAGTSLASDKGDKDEVDGEKEGEGDALSALTVTPTRDRASEQAAITGNIE
jgi:hypothetical protein